MEFSWIETENLKPEYVQLAMTGMTVVFAALTLIAAFIYSLPRVLSVFEGIFPPPPVQLPPENDDDERAAAVSFALHHHRTQ